MLGEISQAQKDSYYVTSRICGTWNCQLHKSWGSDDMEGRGKRGREDDQRALNYNEYQEDPDATVL